MSTLRLMTVVGARPQFIKAAAVSRAIAEHDGAKRISECLIHTGQHYDDAMSRVFFEELRIPRPAANLGLGSGRHGAQTGAMLHRLEEQMLDRRPDWVMVYGDTNSTLAGALAAAKLHIPVAHVEAGLRSRDRRMPEEINRILTDSLATMCLCPADAAVRNLSAEGIVKGVHNVGDVMYDSILFHLAQAGAHQSAARRLAPAPGEYYLATVHRAENADDRSRLADIVGALGRLRRPVVWPVHPRTRKALAGAPPPPNVLMIEPVGYLDMLAIERDARLVLTDSGGVQKEAYWCGVPCVTLRDTTEWTELVECGWNRLCGARPDEIVRAVDEFDPPGGRWTPPDQVRNLYGNGRSAQTVVRLLCET